MGKAVQPPGREMVHIFLLNLKNFFTRNRLLAGAFMLLLVVCLGGALFGVNYIFCNIDSYNIYMSEQNTYRFTVYGKDGGGTASFVREASEQFGNDLLTAYAEFTNTSPSPVPLVGEDGETQIRYDEIMAVADMSDELFSAYAVLGDMFTREQIESGSKVVMLASSVYDPEYLGQTYFVNGEAFTVIGFSPQETMVPLYAMDNTSGVNLYSIAFTYHPDDAEIETLRRAFAAAGGDYDRFSVIVPAEDTVAFMDYLPMLVPTFVLVLLGFVNLNYLYTYFVRMRERMYAVFRLCGAGQGKVLGLFLAEAFFLFTAAFLVGLLAYKIIMPLLYDASFLALMQSGLLLADRLGFGRWACVYLASAACFALAFVPALVRAARADAVVRQEE